MASKTPDPTNPLSGGVTSAAQALQSAASAVVSGQDMAAKVMEKLRLRAELLQKAKGAPQKLKEVGVGLAKIGRGGWGLVGATF